MVDQEFWKHNEDPALPAPAAEGQDAVVAGRPVPVASQDVETIAISHISGPLVILYGPADVGKTVTLLRLCSFVSSSYNVDADENFRSDAQYARSVADFERQRDEEILAPLSTGAIDFLLVNVTTAGTMYCQILEAPGEHFFPRDASAAVQHPFYLQTIFQSSSRKIFALFFEGNLMNNDQRFRAYIGSILRVLRQHADPKRDRVLIVHNKSDERSDLTRNGKPVEKEFRKMLYTSPAFAPLGEYLKLNRFGRIHLVPFSSGQFGRNRDGKRTFAKSPDHYPQALWRAIDDCVKGRPFSFWPWS